ncbi:MAG TPA: Gfo/Idh/MocA family oxidoreductase [Candidatus Dormibacteraeota bacterium]|jgi:predicted dehydrogenase|nr:Gfo/Idh/MocA family oxidoreductase [Candidatus Dormibacteraeota bacterium]
MRVALIGCGFMGQRHVRGLGRLHDIGYGGIELAAVCDADGVRAAEAADLAHSLTGTRPAILSAGEVLAGGTGIEGALVVTPPADHETTVGAALEAGLHVLVEKPISITVGSGSRIIARAAAAGRLLAVAENYRRDPINRLARALLDAGAVGTVYRAEQSSTGRGGQIAISVWRHRKVSGGILVDMGVHYGDILQYLVGPLDTLTGLSRRIEDSRQDAQGQWHEVDSEDVCLGLATTVSGALVQWSMDYAARDERLFRRVVYGTEGTLHLPHDRSGEALRLFREVEGTVRELDQADLMGLVPDFHTDGVTAALFGGDRLANYELPFPVIDANLLAIEQADFADAVKEGRLPEVTGEIGLSALAVAYGWFEAAELGRAIRVAEVIERGGPYQAAIDANLASTEMV